MSHREKRLLVITTILVVLGLGVWLARDDETPPAHAGRSPNATPENAPKPPPITATPSSTGTPTPAPPARAYGDRVAELESMLDAREAPGGELTEDPFRPIPTAGSGWRTPR